MRYRRGPNHRNQVSFPSSISLCNVPLLLALLALLARILTTTLPLLRVIPSTRTSTRTTGTGAEETTTLLPLPIPLWLKCLPLSHTA